MAGVNGSVGPSAPPVSDGTSLSLPNPDSDPADVSPEVRSFITDTCSPSGSSCSVTSSDWDCLRSTCRSPPSSDQYPVSAAAHLHLLGESLSLIGRHLQETNKVACVSSSLSLLLDSLLCALAPLMCLTTQIPELTGGADHTLASTLENIAYVMPGL
ncbi:HMG domain-containing protein 4-like [Kryptolebias marmoratus]|uniref:HMG domain-containing protein 4-like n=1 Tax=Kryptolebias marmoratus TaxID=37003 RepID=UPI000D52FBAB|nr:HMG domain-containing protein 4-like [Kryptolebias marmoratus]